MALFGKRTDLAVPDGVSNNKEAFEILRVWVTQQGLTVTLKSGVWEDPAAYGIMLADLARHIADAFKQGQGKDFDATLHRILEGLNAEFTSPTDTPTGKIQVN